LKGEILIQNFSHPYYIEIQKEFKKPFGGDFANLEPSSFKKLFGANDETEFKIKAVTFLIGLGSFILIPFLGSLLP